jgi:hypothetical protein
VSFHKKKHTHTRNQRISSYLILGWVVCILLRYNKMGHFCCTINHPFYLILFWILDTRLAHCYVLTLIWLSWRYQHPCNYYQRNSVLWINEDSTELLNCMKTYPEHWEAYKFTGAEYYRDIMPELQVRWHTWKDSLFLLALCTCLLPNCIGVSCCYT